MMLIQHFKTQQSQQQCLYFVLVSGIVRARLIETNTDSEGAKHSVFDARTHKFKSRAKNESSADIKDQTDQCCNSFKLSVPSCFILAKESSFKQCLVSVRTIHCFITEEAFDQVKKCLCKFKPVIHQLQSKTYLKCKAQ